MTKQFSDKRIPKILYKFRDWNDLYHRRVLTKREIHFSEPYSFNDPFDSRIPVRWDLIQDLIDSRSVDYKYIHTSDHATLFDLKRLAKAINPKKIVPIHTDNSIKLKQEFEMDGFTNVYLWDDGIEYQL